MVCGVGLLHAYINSGHITTTCAQFQQDSVVIKLGDSYSNNIDMAYSNCSSDDMQYYIGIKISYHLNHGLFSPIIKAP